MLTMHYSIRLKDEAHAAAVRARVQQVAPMFDQLPGLAAKLFLLDPLTPRYAVYYLWRDAEAMHDFLDGPRFAAMCEEFGRPLVQTFLSRATDFPFRAGERIRIDSGAAMDPTRAPMVLYDPQHGAAVALGGRTGAVHEILHISRPLVA